MEKKENAIKEVKIKKDAKIGLSTDKKIMYSIIGFVIVMALGIFGAFYYNNNLRQVVKFDGGGLTASEFTIYYKTFAPMLEYYGYGPEIIPEQIANKAAVDKILLLKAKEAGITLSAEDKAKVDEIFSDEDEIKRFTDDGINPNKMKQLYYNDYIITAYIEKIKEDLTDEEVTEYLVSVYGENVPMTEYVTRHILFSTIDPATGVPMSEEDKAKVKVRANEVLAKVLAGEDFVTLVTEYTDDPGTKDKGGLYNVYLDENTVEEYREATEKLAVGATTTALVETSYGFHIIKLEDKVENGRVNSDAVRTEISNNKIDEMGKEMDLRVNDDMLKKIVQGITGVRLEDDTQETNANIDSHVHDENCDHD